MDVASALIVDGVAFGRTLIGLMTRPYETYRRIVLHGRSGELIFVALMLSCYFVLASIVKVAAFRPYLLTHQFVLLALGVASGVLLSVLCLYAVAYVLSAPVKLKPLIIAWGYTLVPTVMWFFSTSMLHVLLPPPRTASFPGIVFSIVFIVFSITLLWWKITLSYLTIRFCLKLNFVKSLLIALACAPVLTGWSVVMYKIGVFKVPFL